jgi:steroid delta-isomerase-like uncharacterized protein
MNSMPEGLPAAGEPLDAAGGAGGGGGPAANKAVVRRWIEEVWSGGNLAVLDELIGPEYVLHGAADPTTPPGPEGAKRITAAFRDAFPDLQGVIEDLIAEGDRVVCRWTARATHRGSFAGVAATNRRVTFTGIEIVRVVNGQIVEGWDEVDLLGLLEQLDTAPTRG